jgi:hypothetical protein
MGENASAVLGSGEGSIGFRVGLAGLAAAFVLVHVIVNRRSII